MTDNAQRHRLVLCNGTHCQAHDGFPALINCLEDLLGEPTLPWRARQVSRVTWRTANCLNQCEIGPNLVVHPDNQRYNHLSFDVLKTIVTTTLQIPQPD